MAHNRWIHRSVRVSPNAEWRANLSRLGAVTEFSKFALKFCNRDRNGVLTIGNIHDCFLNAIYQFSSPAFVEISNEHQLGRFRVSRRTCSQCRCIYDDCLKSVDFCWPANNLPGPKGSPRIDLRSSWIVCLVEKSLRPRKLLSR